MKSYKIIDNKWTEIKDVSNFTQPPVTLHNLIDGKMVAFGLGYYK